MNIVKNTKNEKTKKAATWSMLRKILQPFLNEQNLVTSELFQNKKKTFLQKNKTA